MKVGDLVVSKTSGSGLHAELGIIVGSMSCNGRIAHSQRTNTAITWRSYECRNFSKTQEIPSNRDHHWT